MFPRFALRGAARNKPELKLMSRYALISAVAATALVAACAGNSETRTATSTPPAATAQQAPTVTPAPAQTADGYTDQQLQAYIAAGREVDALTPPATDEARTQYAQQAGAILQRHSIAPDTYNAIAATARTDTAFAERIAALRVSTVTDATLRSFITAGREIEPINAGLTNATPEQRAPAADQIRDILIRNNLDAPTYNAIATRAQTDTALRARLEAINAANPPLSGE